MNEFDYIIREARKIFDFYGMNREKPVIDEILYNSQYALRHLLGDNKIFDENLKKEVPVLDVIQQVFNNVNQHYSWIVAGNQRGYDENQLRNDKFSMDNMFYVVFTKPHYEDSSKKIKKGKNDKTQILALCLAKGVKLQRLLGGNPMNKIYFCFLLSVLVCQHNYATFMIVFFVFIQCLCQVKPLGSSWVIVV